MKDNYERDEKLSACDDCINRFNWEKCNTCKHRKKFIQVPGTSPFPIWPFNIEPYRTISYPDNKLYCNSQQDKTTTSKETADKTAKFGFDGLTKPVGIHNQTKKKGGAKWK